MVVNRPLQPKVEVKSVNSSVNTILIFKERFKVSNLARRGVVRVRSRTAVTDHSAILAADW